MEITVTIPDDVASRLLHDVSEPSRALLEAAAAEAYREGRLTGYELLTLLGLTRYELDGFLKARGIWIEYTPEQLDADMEFQRAFIAERQRKSA